MHSYKYFTVSCFLSCLRELWKFLNFICFILQKMDRKRSSIGGRETSTPPDGTPAKGRGRVREWAVAQAREQERAPLQKA